VRLDQVVLRALEKDPERRYQQASEVKTDVDTIAHKAPPPSTGPAWQYDLGAAALTLSCLGLTAGGLWQSKSAFALTALLAAWVFLHMAVSRSLKLMLDGAAIVAGLALIAWGVWLEQSAWALLGLVPAGLGFGACRHAYGRGWDNRFGEGVFLPALGFVGALGVVFLGMTVGESAWPLTAVLALLASVVVGSLAVWPLADEEGWKAFVNSDAQPADAQADAPAEDGSETGEEEEKEEEDSGWGCLIWIGIFVLFSSGVVGFVGGAFGDLHQFLTEELPVDPRLRRPAALGVYVTAIAALCLFAWGAWRVVVGSESEKTSDERKITGKKP
jgi:hypothetical protein